MSDCKIIIVKWPFDPDVFQKGLFVAQKAICVCIHVSTLLQCRMANVILCSNCWCRINGDILHIGITAYKGKFYCGSCSETLATCAKCTQKTMMRSLCIACGFQMDKCEHCASFFTNGVRHLGKNMCETCFNKIRAAPPNYSNSTVSSCEATPASSSPPFSLVHLYPPDSIGCYRRDVCKGSCNCDSQN